MQGPGLRWGAGFRDGADPRRELSNRLLNDAAALRNASSAIEAAVHDERQLAILTDDQGSSKAAAAVIEVFTRSLEQASPP